MRVTSVFGHERLQDFPPPLLQCCQSSRFVMLHEMAVTNHVGGHDGGKAALRALFGHVSPLPLESPIQRIVCAVYCQIYPGPDVRIGSTAPVRRRPLRV